MRDVSFHNPFISHCSISNAASLTKYSLHESFAESEEADYSHDNEPLITARPSPEIDLRRSSRKNKGQYASTRYINEVFLSAVDQIGSLDEYHNALIYQAELETDMAAFESEITDPRVIMPSLSESLLILILLPLEKQWKELKQINTSRL